MRRYHIVFKVYESDFYSKGLFVEALSPADALIAFKDTEITIINKSVEGINITNKIKGSDTIFLAMYVTDNGLIS